MAHYHSSCVQMACVLYQQQLQLSKQNHPIQHTHSIIFRLHAILYIVCFRTAINARSVKGLSHDVQVQITTHTCPYQYTWNFAAIILMTILLIQFSFIAGNVHWLPPPPPHAIETLVDANHFWQQL